MRVNVYSCVCARMLFDENRQTELTNCPREQILRVGVWIQIIVLAGSEFAVFTRDWSHGGNGGRCVCPHTPSSRAEQHIGKLIMSKSGRGTNLLPHAIRKKGGGGGCASPDSSGWMLLPSSTYKCICIAAIIPAHRGVEIIQIQTLGLNINA